METIWECTNDKYNDEGLLSNASTFSWKKCKLRLLRFTIALLFLYISEMSVVSRSCTITNVKYRYE